MLPAATIDENAPIVLVRPPSELVKMGIADSSTLWRCTKACYGLKESPKMWESHRDATLADRQWHQGGLQYYLQQSHRHPSMWYIMQGKPTSEKKMKTLRLDDGEVPRSFDALKGHRVGTFIVYVDDLLAVGKKSILETFFKKIQTVWEIATPEYLTGDPEDVESIRSLGMEIEVEPSTNNWIVHQQPYVMETLN
eukprot:6483317-Amphidinium_carterae.1